MFVWVLLSLSHFIDKLLYVYYIYVFVYFYIFIMEWMLILYIEYIINYLEKDLEFLIK